MKLIHLSDLHLGKRVNEFSMIEDQEYILSKIIEVIDNEKPDAVMIAGDVYDRSVPSEDAMKLWDFFLGELADRKLYVMVISGNHDSAVRLSVHEKLIHNAGICISPVYDGTTKKCTYEDEFGPVNFYLLPFIKPSVVRSFFKDVEINDYTDACRVAIEQMDVDENERNILLAHQFVTGATRCESEEIVVGGLDNVNADVFYCFDYVALGHIHGCQSVERPTIRYCGTPLKYSFSEKGHTKSVTVVEIMQKGDLEIREVPLEPLRDLREIKGTYNELTLKSNYMGTNVNDYLHVVLTDEEDVPDAIGKLRLIYPNIMKLSYDNTRTRQQREVIDAKDIEMKNPMDLFEELYELQNNKPMSDEQKEFATSMMDAVWGGRS